jgi:small-conductance mechanosensitive channel
MNELIHAFDGLLSSSKAVAAQYASIWLPIQLGLIALVAGISAGIALLIRRRANLASLTMGWPPYLRLVTRAAIDNLGTIIFIVLIGAIHAGMQQLAWPSHSYLLGVATSLATAWVVIALLASLIRNRFVHRLVAISAWTIAALSILGLLGPLSNALNSVAVEIGGLRISPLLIIKTAALMLITLWIAIAASNFLDRRVRSLNDLTPSVQVLLGKLVRFGLITVAILVVLSSVGIDLSALALFSGAVGVGLGFGLQKIVSNFISGIILLADKSIKPGDVISLGESFGWVSEMSARYTSVLTRDGREYLIPNEDFITQRVINWSYSNDMVRLDVEFGVSYGSDPHVVQRLALQAAAGIPRVLATPVPVCHMTAFGDSSLNFLLRFWINDPAEGLTNIRGQMLLALWDAFKREGIEIPFPQRDLNMRTPLKVVVERDKLEAEVNKDAPPAPLDDQKTS